MSRNDSNVGMRTHSVKLHSFVIRTHRAWFVAAIIGGTLFVLYLSRLARTVGAGDTADLQAQTTLLGVGHSPGYILQIFAGKLFLLVTPAWGEVAYRLNFFIAICGVAACLFLYAAIYNITKNIVAASWGALVLGMSSTHWEQSIATEVYVFHSLFIVLAILFLTQHAGSGHLRYLHGACLALGVAVAGRPSEAFIIPAFVPPFALAYRGLPLKLRNLFVSLCVFLAPFAFSVGYYFALYNTDLLLTEDQRAVEDIVETVDGGDGQPGKSLSEAFRYCLALKWLDRSLENPKAASRANRANRYWKLLTGRLDSGTGKGRATANQLGGNPTSVGPAALAVAVAAVLLPGGPWPWLLCGLGLFVGNFAFYLWYPQSGGLTFVLPSIIGISLVAGIGAHKIGSRGKWLRVAVAMLLVAVAASLYLANRDVVGRSFLTEPLQQRQMSVEEAKQIPHRSILVASYRTVSTYRYIVQVAADRRDIQIVKWDGARKGSLIRRLASTGRPVFVMGNSRMKSGKNTPAVLAKYNFRRVR